jgi:hypothetical protein
MRLLAILTNGCIASERNEIPCLPVAQQLWRLLC